MASKIMLEATQSVVTGNDVAVHSGELFELGADLPDGVTARPVVVDVPDPAPAAAEDKPAARAPAKGTGK